ncbi:matrixin family metalloprotease [Persicimonas caeni]|uniref:Matrixin family metalloprotease n=2 Tax=Persicimonas caeni TaxID=2292766 RepID=A0A4Y6Q1N1_PERCE|nr:matrixin family metalloprotease [Persicimonas caeni]QED35653.1 matrixin family metalloprotease [Persicimonas caeni]
MMFRPSHTITGLLAATLLCAGATNVQASTWAEPPAQQQPWLGYGWFVENGWPIPVEDFPVRFVFLGEAPAGVSFEQVERAARNAAASWTDVPCASAQVVYAGHRPSLDEVGPGEIPFLFTSPQNATCFLPQTVGFTKLGCVDEYPNRTVFLNSADYDWSPEPRPFQPAYTDPSGEHRLTVDVESVLTHELGHVLGLSHTDDTLATMAPSYRGDGGMRTLAVDDKLGLCAIYEVATPRDECSSGRDCALGHRCDMVESLRLCRETRGEVGEACALDRLVCEEACVLAPNPGDFGYCTVTCEAEADDCPDGYRCTEGLLVADLAHCERIAAPDEPTCASTGSQRSVLPSLWWVVAAACFTAARRRVIRKRVR